MVCTQVPSNLTRTVASPKPLPPPGEPEGVGQEVFEDQNVALEGADGARGLVNRCAAIIDGGMLGDGTYSGIALAPFSLKTV